MFQGKKLCKKRYLLGILLFFLPTDLSALVRVSLFFCNLAKRRSYFTSNESLNRCTELEATSVALTITRKQNAMTITVFKHMMCNFFQKTVPASLNVSVLNSFLISDMITKSSMFMIVCQFHF